MLLRAALIVALLASLLLAGCNGARETDEIAWVISMGIDRAADGDLLVTYRTAVPQALAAGDGGGAGKESSTVETVKAASLPEARNILNASLSRRVSLLHVTAIVLSEEVARAGVQDVVAPILRFREFRGPVFLLVVRGGVKMDELFKANKPEIETIVSRWVHNYMRHHDEVGYFLPFTLHDFYLRLKAGSGAPLAVAYGLNPQAGYQPGAAVQPGGRAASFLPGGLPRRGGNPTELAGTAVFKEDKLVGFLDTDPLEPRRSVSLTFRNGRAPKYTVDITGGRPVVTIDVLLEGEIIAVPSGINYEAPDYLRLVEKQLSDNIQEQILSMLARAQGWGADVADIGYHIRPKFATVPEMRGYGWDRRYSQAIINVVVSAEIRRTGLFRKTAPIRRGGGG
jgi:spore germination protein KC